MTFNMTLILLGSLFLIGAFIISPAPLYKKKRLLFYPLVVILTPLPITLLLISLTLRVIMSFVDICDDSVLLLYKTIKKAVYAVSHEIDHE